jgi:pimeloyl-ACP methyl ester carboxylesterase
MPPVASSQPPMPPRRWIAAAVGLAASAVLAACGGDDPDATTTKPAAPAPPHVSARDLRPCGDHLAKGEFRCGSIEVPWERADPSLGKVRIAFAVREPDNPEAKERAPLLAVEGGPGYPSIGSASDYVALFGPLLRNRRLILVDQRGTGRSEALDCPDLQEGRAPQWIAIAECARRLGPRFESYRTAASADDLDDVRRALGIERIAMYGDSYGTYLAQSYAFRHPDTLRALVLDSAYPVRGESGWYPSLIRSGIRDYAIACRRDSSCPGDPAGRFDDFVAKLRNTGQGVGPVIDKLFNAGFDPPTGYLRIDRAAQAVLEGDLGPWRRMTGARRATFGRADIYSHTQELAVSCNDYPMIWRDKSAPEVKRRELLEKEIRSYPRDAFDPFTPREVALSSESGYLDCLTWPAPTELYEPPAGPGDEPTSAPVLVVSGELDSVTTPHEGKLVTKLFPDAKQFIVPNAGHVDALYYPDGSAGRRIRAFLRKNG